MKENLAELFGRIERVAAEHPKERFDKYLETRVRIQFDLPQGSTEERLRNLEEELGFPLRQSHRALLLRWDGPTLFDARARGTNFGMDEWCMSLDSFAFLGTAALTDFAGTAIDPSDGRPSLFIAEGHGVAFHMQPESDGLFVMQEGVWTLFCDSLETFLANILDSDGAQFWEGNLG